MPQAAGHLSKLDLWPRRSKLSIRTSVCCHLSGEVIDVLLHPSNPLYFRWHLLLFLFSFFSFLFFFSSFFKNILVGPFTRAAALFLLRHRDTDGVSNSLTFRTSLPHESPIVDWTVTNERFEIFVGNLFCLIYWPSLHPPPLLPAVSFIRWRTDRRIYGLCFLVTVLSVRDKKRLQLQKHSSCETNWQGSNIEGPQFKIFWYE